MLEILAEELETIEDPALEFVFFSAVEVDKDLNRAQVYFSSLEWGGADWEQTKKTGPAARGDLTAHTSPAVHTDPAAHASPAAQASLTLSEVQAQTSEALSEHIRSFRKAMAKQAHLRRIPELIFLPDASFQHGAHIEQILRNLNPEDGLGHKDSPNPQDGSEHQDSPNPKNNPR